MSDEQVLEYVKEAFSPMTEAQLFKIDDINTAIGKARVLGLLFKSTPPQPMSSLMLAHMTDRYDNADGIEQSSKTKPNTFHKSVYKTRINPEGLTQVTQN